jgi:hypothetical protein
MRMKSTTIAISMLFLFSFQSQARAAGQNYSIVINSGSPATSLATVSLAIVAPKTTKEMYITNIAGCASGGAWKPFQKTLAGWALGQANSTARVYGIFREGKKLSSCVSDDILQDGIAPVASLNSTPPATSSTSSANFTFSAADSGSGVASFECRLDGGLSACSGSAAYVNLTDGTHFFSVTAVDKAGNRSTPASHMWLVDTIKPALSFTQAPSSGTSTSAHFEFSVTDSGSGPANIYCQLDSNLSAPCSSPLDLQGLASGAHSFFVTAYDAAGNSTLATHSWTVETVNPPASSFTIGGIDPGGPSILIAPGSSDTRQISILSDVNPANPVTITIGALPAGLSATLDSAVCTPSCSINLTVSAAAEVLTGSYPFSLTVSDGQKTENLTIQALIDPAYAEPQPALSDLLAIGDRVRVAPQPLDVRRTPTQAGEIISVQPTTSLGAVLAGPRNIAGEWYWRVRYDSGVEGWSSEEGLRNLSITLSQDGSFTAVLVELKLDVAWKPEADLTSGELAAQQAAITDAQNRVIAALGSHLNRVTLRSDSSPDLGLEVDATGVNILASLDTVIQFANDGQATEAEIGAGSIGSQGAIATAAAPAGASGAGKVIVIIDTGVDPAHRVFSGNPVLANEGACFSALGDCPNGQTEMIGPGAGQPCSVGLNGSCYHGTRVAGVAAGNDPGQSYLGVAPNAKIIPIRVGGLSDSILCGNLSRPCRRSTAGEMDRALDYVYNNLRKRYDIAAVNYSLVQSHYRSARACDRDEFSNKRRIDLLRSVGIPFVAAAGNEYQAHGSGYVGSPACISSAISVGATNAAGDMLWSQSDAAGMLSLLAPGENIRVPILGNIYSNLGEGTSFAAPYVAGVFARYKEFAPTISIRSKLATLQAYSRPVKDTRDSNPNSQLIQCAVKVDKAMEKLNERVRVYSRALSRDETYLNGINKCGQIVGSAIGIRDQFDWWSSFVISEENITALPKTFGSHEAMQAQAINNLGAVVGYSANEGYFLSTDQLNFQYFKPLGANSYAEAYGINDQNMIVGSLIKSSLDYIGFLKAGWTIFRDGTNVTGINNFMQTVGANVAWQGVYQSNFVSPVGINSGSSLNFGNQTKLYGINSTLTNLSAPPSASNLGEIVGSIGTFWVSRGFVYSKGQLKMIPAQPNELRSQLLGINDGGYAVGSYCINDYECFGYLINTNL